MNYNKLAEFVDVVGIEEISETEDVYDIEVEETHNFFANDLLVHNCIAGNPSKFVFDNQKTSDSNLWVPNDDNLELIQSQLRDMIEGFQEALGPENYYLEIQFNKLQFQHLANKHIIEASKRTGCPLVVTCDAHYVDPGHWKQREIYKLMGRSFYKNKTGEDPKKFLPQTIDELKCELYPKNAQQVWESYKEYSKLYDFYDDTIVKEAIERTHEIAHQQIGDAHPDKKVKLPSIKRIVEPKELDNLHQEFGQDADEDTLAFKEIKKLALEGLKLRKVENKKEYVERLRHELEVIKHLKFGKYFLTYYWIMKVVGEKMLVGNARGCFLPGTQVINSGGELKAIESYQPGDRVFDKNGVTQMVLGKMSYFVKNENITTLEFDDGTIVHCTTDHKFLDRETGRWIDAMSMPVGTDIKEISQENLPIRFTIVNDMEYQLPGKWGIKGEVDHRSGKRKKKFHPKTQRIIQKLDDAIVSGYKYIERGGTAEEAMNNIVQQVMYSFVKANAYKEETRKTAFKLLKSFEDQNSNRKTAPLIKKEFVEVDPGNEIRLNDTILVDVHETVGFQFYNTDTTEKIFVSFEEMGKIMDSMNLKEFKSMMKHSKRF